MKIIFAGTPQFAVPFLEALIKSPHQVIAVYTRPDKPAGRGLELTASPVKQYALMQQIPIHQPISFRDVTKQQQLQQLAADVLIDVAYGALLPPAILSATQFGCINVHPSLLPRWRGASPIQHAILAGDNITGVTIMQMDEGLDTGDILCQQSITIDDNDTTASLSEKLIPVGISLLLNTLDKISTNTCNKIIQDEKLGTYATKITKEEAKINWHQSAQEISCLIRAFIPWPIAHSNIAQNTVRIWQATPLTKNKDGDNALSSPVRPGTIVAADYNGIDVATKNGVLRILKLQLPGKKALPIKDILNAHSNVFKPGTIFT